MICLKKLTLFESPEANICGESLRLWLHIVGQQTTNNVVGFIAIFYKISD